jgi:hypothetical protein
MPSTVLSQSRSKSEGRVSRRGVVSPTLEWAEHRPADLKPACHQTRNSDSEAGRFAVLLEDPSIALWAMETSRRFGVSPICALESLADALVRDVATKKDPRRIGSKSGA